MLNRHLISTNNFSIGWRNSDSSITFIHFILLLTATLGLVGSNIAPFGFILFGILSVAVFLIGLATLPRHFLTLNPIKRKRSFFIYSFFIKLIFIFSLLIYYYSIDGTLMGPNATDNTGYHYIPMWMLNELHQTGSVRLDYWTRESGGIGEMGYMYWTFCWYLLFGPQLWLHSILNIILSSLSVILVYKIASKQFDEKVGVLAAVMMMLHPFFYYYISLSLKETLMIWIVLMFLHYAQKFFYDSSGRIKSLFIAMVFLFFLAFFRNFLIPVLLSALLMQYFYRGGRKMSVMNLFGGVLIFIAFYALMVSLDVIPNIANTFNSAGDSFGKVVARREGNSVGISFASLPAFLLFVFSGPLPTLVNTPGQENILLQYGGAYIRNLMLVFSIFGIWYAYKQGFRSNIMLLFFLFAYLFILAYSGYATSTRYNLVALPVMLIYSAVGIQKMSLTRTRNYHIIYLIILFIAIVSWNYIKLSGRGMI